MAPEKKLKKLREARSALLVAAAALRGSGPKRYVETIGDLMRHLDREMISLTIKHRIAYEG